MCTTRVNVTACKFDLIEDVQKRQFPLLSEMSDSRELEDTKNPDKSLLFTVQVKRVGL